MSLDARESSLRVDDFPSGILQQFDFSQEGVTDIQCSSPGGEVYSEGTRFWVNLGLRESAGSLFFKCKTNQGNKANFYFNYLPSRLRLLTTSREPEDFTAPVYNPASDWLVFPSTRYSAEHGMQIYAEHKSSGEVVAVSSLDGGFDTLADKDSSLHMVFDDLVLFSTSATNLSPTANGQEQIYIKDLSGLSEAPILVSTTDGSTPANAGILSASFSPDKSKVFMDTAAANFGASGGVEQVYYKTLSDLSQAPVLVSTTDGTTQGDGAVGDFVPGNSKVLLTTSSANFPQANGAGQIYMKDLANLSAAPVLVSGVDATTPGDLQSASPRLSPDESKAFFLSRSTNFSGANGEDQLYMKNLSDLSQPPSLVSTPDGVTGATLGGGVFAMGYGLTSEGDYALISGSLSNFPGANSRQQLYLKKLSPLTDPPLLISGPDATTGGDHMAMISGYPVQNADQIYFWSGASNLNAPVELNLASMGLFSRSVSDLSSPPTFLRTWGAKGPNSVYSEFSSNLALFSKRSTSAIHFIGLLFEDYFKYVGFYLYALDMNPFSPSKTLLSAPDASSKGAGLVIDQSQTQEGNALFVAMMLGLPGTNGAYQLYFKDTSNTSSPALLVSTHDGTNPGTGNSLHPAIHQNLVAFSSNATEFSGANGVEQVYTKDLDSLSSAPVLISSTDGSTGGSASSRHSTFDPTGSKLFFFTNSANFPNANGDTQLYYKDRSNLNDPPVLVSGMDATTALTDGVISDIQSLAVSPDGSKVFFVSYSGQPSGANGLQQIYYKNLSDLSEPPVLVSTLDGSAAAPSAVCGKFGLHPNGRYILMICTASNFSGANGQAQLYLKDFTNLSKAPLLLSTVDGATAIEYAPSGPDISPDGTGFLFSTQARINGIPGGVWYGEIPTDY